MARRAVGAGVVVAVLGGLGVVQLLPGSTPLSAPPARAGELVPYAGCDALVDDLRARLAARATARGGVDEGLVQRGVAASAGAAEDAAASVPAAPGAPTGTNLQEAGVDEPDVAKLSGGLLLTLTAGGLDVVRTGAQPEPLARLDLPGGAVGGELLVAGDRVLVVAQDGGGGAAEDSVAPGRGSAASSRLPGPGAGGRTVLHLADLSDPAAPRWLEEWSVDGGYVSARLVDGSVRLVTRSTPVVDAPPFAAPYGPLQEVQALAVQRAAALALDVDDVLPRAVHRVGGEVVAEGAAVACADVASDPAAAGESLLLVTTLRPGEGLAPTGTTSVRADGDLVYAAADRLVVATSRWGTTAGSGAAPEGEATTQLHAFDTSDPRTTRYVATGDVPGYVHGRWALSWHEGALRVATTEGAPWGGAQDSSSTLTVLQERGGDLVPSGRVEGLGRTEQVQAVRFLGDLATVVTFRQTDPLYVLDLADPAAPRLLGELKVPGFSTYLHPLGGDRLLGLGMEADPATGRTTGVQASVFDLSDLSAPVQLSRVQLGEGWSEALQESRAFSWDGARGLAVLPFVRSLPVEPYQASYALGLRVASDGTVTEAGRLPLPATAYASRVLLDGERAYAVTDASVVVGALDGLAPLASLPLR